MPGGRGQCNEYLAAGDHASFGRISKKIVLALTGIMDPSKQLLEGKLWIAGRHQTPPFCLFDRFRGQNRPQMPPPPTARGIKAAFRGRSGCQMPSSSLPAISFETCQNEALTQAAKCSLHWHLPPGIHCAASTLVYSRRGCQHPRRRGSCLGRRESNF